MSAKPGRRHGLHMILNTNQWDYMRPGTDVAGVKLVVHPQKIMPFPEDEGIMLSPGHSISVDIRQVEMIRENHPYGSCQSPAVNHSDISVYEKLYPVVYSNK
ncbi:hypothetical protein LSH36_487g04011, partial [Paralvinella palmiformis]